MPRSLSADSTAMKLDQTLVSSSAARDPMVGTSLLGRYVIEDVLGEGGSSVIYRGVHTTIGRTVAIKMLRPELVRNDETVARFLREGRAACRVRHEHVVEATDFGVTPDGAVFLVMEYLEGENLAVLLDREGPLPWPRARAIALQICEAIEAAHAAGVIHRDITLQNCVRVHRERNPDYMKVIDFGIAKMLEPNAPRTDECGVTDNAEIFGTPEYMAPEQVRRTIDADWRSDVYALGAVLYALVTGRLPLRGTTALDTLVRQIHEDVVPPSALVTGIPTQLEAAILRALAKDPDTRFQRMAELATALERVPVLGLVDRPALVCAVEPSVVLEGPVTASDLDLPELGDHDIRGERPMDRLLRRPRRSWAEIRWPIAAVAACALLLAGVHLLGRDLDASSATTQTVEAAVVGNVASPESTPTPTRPTAPAPIALPGRAIAIAVTTPPPMKPGKASRRSANRRAEAELAPPSARQPAAIETDEVVDLARDADATNDAAEGAAEPEPVAPAAVPEPPTPDPFAPSDAADEIKDPFTAPQ